MRRLLPSLMLALTGAAVVVVAAGPAQAAKCEAPTVKKAARAADVVFVGTLTRGAGKGASSYTFEGQTLYAGNLASRTVTVRADDKCTLTGLKPDADYLVFARQSSGALTTATTDGTTRATPKAIRQVEVALGTGEDLASSGTDTTKPSFTRVADATPPTLTRVAAPGVAMVLIGLLGLLVVRRRA